MREPRYRTLEEYYRLIALGKKRKEEREELEEKQERVFVSLFSSSPMRKVMICFAFISLAFGVFMYGLTFPELDREMSIITGAPSFTHTSGYRGRTSTRSAYYFNTTTIEKIEVDKWIHPYAKLGDTLILGSTPLGHFPREMVLFNNGQGICSTQFPSVYDWWVKFLFIPILTLLMPLKSTFSVGLRYFGLAIGVASAIIILFEWT